jgi:hypothetical protein
MKLTSMMKQRRLQLQGGGGTTPLDPKMPKMTDIDDMDRDNMIIEYNSNNVFGDLK